jgi:hypothetical protein
MMARDTHPRRWWAISLLLALLLTGCDGLAPAGGPVPTPLPTVIPVAWDERAAVTLIRADAFVQPLSDEDFAARVPQCAIFGDDRVRWVEPPAEDAPLPDGPGRVFESPIDGARLDALARTIADSGFFALNPVYGPDLGPVRELTIRLEGMGTHTVRVASIETAPEAFEALYGLCDSLRQPDNAQEVIPTGAWLHVYPQAAPAAYHLEWPFNAPPLDALAEQPRWYSDSGLISTVWTAQRDYGAAATFGDATTAYRVVARAEGFTLDTPRQPREQGDPLPPSALWSTDPQERVFVAQLAGGLPTPHEYIGANVVDFCTIFGDGRVVISEQPIGVVQEGYLTEREMTRFLDGWLSTGFMDAPTGGDPTPLPADIVRQVVTIQLYEGDPATRTFPMGTSYPGSVRNPCDITDFTILVPDSAFLFAEPVGPVTRFDRDYNVALVDWPGHFPELEELASPRRFEDDAAAGTTAEPVIFAWEHLHGLHDEPNVLFVRDGIAFAVYLDVPSITPRDAPAIGTLTPPTPTPPGPAVTAIATEEATEEPAE